MEKLVAIAVAEETPTQDLSAITALGRAYLENGAYRLARVIFEGLTALAPSEPGHLTTLGVVADCLGDSESAQQFFREALSNCPDNVLAATNLGECLLVRGERDAALSLFRQALANAGPVDGGLLANKLSSLLHHLEEAPCVA